MNIRSDRHTHHIKPFSMTLNFSTLNKIPQDFLAKNTFLVAANVRGRDLATLTRADCDKNYVEKCEMRRREISSRLLELATLDMASTK